MTDNNEMNWTVRYNNKDGMASLHVVVTIKIAEKLSYNNSGQCNRFFPTGDCISKCEINNKLTWILFIHAHKEERWVKSRKRIFFNIPH